MAVMFVTATPGSELAKQIRSRLKSARIPIKIAEKSGPKLSQILVKTNPHQSNQCSRDGCLACENKDARGKSKCDKEGVNYALVCQSCPGGTKIYIGESSSTSYTRGKQHLYQYKLHGEGKKGGKDSVMGRHVDEKHGGDHTVKFSMTVLSSHVAQPHVRQCSEKARIDHIGQDNLINARGERATDMVSQTSSTVPRSRPAE